jgi:hypothetical protein
METLTEKQANAIKQELLEARENEALEEIHKLGFRVTTHDMGRYVEADDLLGIKAGYIPGNCYAVMYARDGKRKHVAGGSAVEALQQAQAWWAWQQRLGEDAANKFVPSIDNEPTAVPVRQEVGGSNRRREGERRIVSFASGTAEIVDAHGDPLPEATHASQFATPDQKETTR